AHAQCACLAARATAVERHVDVVDLGGLGEPQRLEHLHPVGARREVLLHLATVDRDLAGTGADPDAGHGTLAATGGLHERLGHRRLRSQALARARAWSMAYGVGCWAACGC